MFTIPLKPVEKPLTVQFKYYKTTGLTPEGSQQDTDMETPLTQTNPSVREPMTTQYHTVIRFSLKSYSKHFGFRHREASLVQFISSPFTFPKDLNCTFRLRPRAEVNHGSEPQKGASFSITFLRETQWCSRVAPPTRERYSCPWKHRSVSHVPFLSVTYRTEVKRVV